MNNKEDCAQCSLVFCIDNKRYSSEYRKKMRNKCFIEILGASCPTYCHTCIISKTWAPIEEYEKAIRAFQVTEKNIPCFRLKAACSQLWIKRYDLPAVVEEGELRIKQPDSSTYETLMISGIKLVPVLKSGENELYSSQNILFERANNIARYGERAARFLLEFQDELPEEWINRCRLLFPGTKRMDLGENVYIPALLGSDEKWFLHFLMANGYFNKFDFFVSVEY